MADDKLPENLAQAFEYLDDLRESGETNMYGARPYLMRDMGYDGAEAGAVLSAWMATFDESPADDRAAKALAA